jgi:hypothetical protein
VERHCVVPDGFQRGAQFVLVPWQVWALMVGQLAPAFQYRRSQIVLPQKAGKAPYTAAHICVEAVGPALFAGWARAARVGLPRSRLRLRLGVRVRAGRGDGHGRGRRR